MLLYRPGHYDEIRLFADEEIRNTHRCIFEYHMVDGTGMCGACRITIGGKTKFVCVDGPEFDGHQVDFDEMLKRMGAFKNIEREEMHKLEEPQTCQATGENTQAEDEKAAMPLGAKNCANP